MQQLSRYPADLWHIDRTAPGLTPEQTKRAENVFKAKTARAACYTRELKRKNNTLIFSVYGSKKVYGSYAQTDYIFKPSGVLQIDKYDPRTGCSNITYWQY